jgi:hypothetical protein
VKTEYSLETYSELLQLALSEGYVSRSFLDPIEGEERVILLRHDVDFSLKMAEVIAVFNAAEKIQGTFFVQLRSPWYNLLSYENEVSMQMIEVLGQRKGLHYHIPPSLDTDDDGLYRDLIDAEFESLDIHVPSVDAVFTWHNPTKSILDRKLEVPGLVNPYNLDIPYVSDSCMRYTPQAIAEVIREGHPRLHLLLQSNRGRGMAQHLAPAYQGERSESDE